MISDVMEDRLCIAAKPHEVFIAHAGQMLRQRRLAQPHLGTQGHDTHFTECPPFGGYKPDPNSLFLTFDLTG